MLINCSLRKNDSSGQKIRTLYMIEVNNFSINMPKSELSNIVYRRLYCQSFINECMFFYHFIFYRMMTNNRPSLMFHMESVEPFRFLFLLKQLIYNTGANNLVLTLKYKHDKKTY